MKKSMQKFVNTGSSHRAERLRDFKNNTAAVYYWQPGYSLLEKTHSSEGKVIERKIFKPTSTVEMAISFLTRYYGPKEFIKHKSDIHPGHVSLAVKDRYLSIGTNEDFRRVSLMSHHNLVFADSLIQEVVGFERIPHCVDLHTLDTPQMVKFIDEFKKSPSLYSLLGSRFNLAEGESCATVVHACLIEGNFSQLLDFVHSQFLSERFVLTPTSLKDYCEIARSNEHSTFPAVAKLSENFQKDYKRDMDNLEKKLKLGDTKSESEITRPTSFKS